MLAEPALRQGHKRAPIDLSSLGMMIASIPAVWIGDRLAQKTPMKAVNLLSAVLFVAMGLITLAGTPATSDG